ncbi:MAG: AAA family ATPase [Clostridia bacterium]|nr:AAA family ATPase [Clostridia bacterium]
MAKVIAIMNQKGGVAKTTTAINASAGLAKHGKRVLLIDLDGQGNLSRGLGCKAKGRSQYTIRGALINIQMGIPTAPDKGILKARFDPVCVTPCNIQIDAFALSLKEDPNRQVYLRRYVNTVRQYFDYILIDCSPSVGVMTQNALVAADSVMIPVDPEFFGAEGVEQIVATMTDVQRKVIATIVSDENGIAETGLLPFGTYTIQEAKTVAGYDLDPSIYTITLAYKDQSTPIVYAEQSINNKRIPGSVKIKKVCEFFDTKTTTFKTGPLEGAVFGLYTAEPVKMIPKNTLVSLLITDKDGIATSDTTLPFGKYYLKELKVPDETIHLIEESFPVTVSGVNTDYVKKPIENELFKGNIAVWKSDDYDPDRMLEGAQYEIRDKDGLLYDTMTTDKDGYAISIDLPVGTYYVKEVVPPAGFVLSDEMIEVKITTDNKATIVFERTNEQTHIVLKKTDFSTGKPVYEAFYEIKNSKGEVVFEGETDLNGEIILYEPPADTYTFTETVAVKGFTLSPETFTFTVDYHGNITGTTDITDEPTCLQLNKLNLYTGKPFAGVEFRLVDSDGQTVRTVLYTPEPEILV